MGRVEETVELVQRAQELEVEPPARLGSRRDLCLASGVKMSTYGVVRSSLVGKEGAPVGSSLDWRHYST